jgi:CRISPR-associated protein Cmr2
MRFDLYAELSPRTGLPADAALPEGLASGFVDECTSWFTRGNNERNEARRRYLEWASSHMLTLPSWLQIDPPPLDGLPDRSWLAFEARFKLETPWYSRDDRPFHVLDNPVRKDRVFGVPYLAAATWKGLLRWACRMQAGLCEHLAQHGGRLDGWSDPFWIVHLFGNEKDEAEDFQRGILAFYPTWFSRIGFEVINPHSRRTRAGTQPIYYEVVPAGTDGVLRLLHAPAPGDEMAGRTRPAEGIGKLLDAIEALLTTYGISAKRTVGWGTATVTRWEAHPSGQPPIEATALADFKRQVEASVSVEARGG